MRRLAYLARLLDRRDVVFLVAIVIAALGIASACGFITAVHRERLERERLLDAKDKLHGRVYQHAGWRVIGR